MRFYKIILDAWFHFALVIDDGEFSICLVVAGRGVEVESAGYGAALVCDLDPSSN